MAVRQLDEPTAPPRTQLARRPVAGAMLALGAVLSVFSNGYGFHRDELYFRALPPAWGYVDQPPMTPLIAHALAAVSDAPWVMRIPATAASVASVVVVVALCREFGGGRTAQTVCAWGYAFGAFPLAFGHLLLTATFDLLWWPLVILCSVRALMRDPRWWAAAGLALGLASYNKLLIGLLVMALLVGLAVAGPWRVFGRRWWWVGVGIALLVALPNLIYQVSNDWPQLAMARALGDANAGEIRALLVPFLFVLLGPPQAVVAGVGVWRLLTRPSWRPARALAPALLAMVVLSFVGGGQLYYPLGLVVAVFAIGCVPVGDWIDRRMRRVLAGGLLALSGVVAAVISLPVLPLSVLGSTPVPAANSSVPDMVGWQRYAEQVAEVYRVAAATDPRTVVITSNYGEYGALVQYGPDLGVPQPFSAHNELVNKGTPPSAQTVLLVGSQVETVRRLFGACVVEANLDNGVDVDNEEQGEPVAICTGPSRPLPRLWPEFAHLD